jgi:hypothetical protein
MIKSENSKRTALTAKKKFRIQNFGYKIVKLQMKEVSLEEILLQFFRKTFHDQNEIILKQRY